MKEQIRKKVDRILNFDSASSTKLSQSTMDHVEHSQLIREVLEEGFPQLFERIEQLEELLRFELSERKRLEQGIKNLIRSMSDARSMINVNGRYDDADKILFRALVEIDKPQALGREE